MIINDKDAKEEERQHIHARHRGGAHTFFRGGNEGNKDHSITNSNNNHDIHHSDYNGKHGHSFVHKNMNVKR